MKKINFWKKVLVYGVLYLLTAVIIASIFLFSPTEENKYPIIRLFIIGFASVLLMKYFVYMSLSPWYDVLVRLKLKKKERSRNLNLYTPKVSVVIPGWNEEVGLLPTVKTVLNSEYKNIEIVVINDGSTDNSHSIMTSFLSDYERANLDKSNKIPIIYHYVENGGKGRALNRGIAVSSGQLIISIDADCALLPDTVSNFVKHFEDKKVMAAVGNVKIGNPESILGTLQYLEFLFSFYFKKADSLLNTIYIIGGAAGAFRREVFDKVGFYNHKNITEDIDLSVRIQDAGMKIVYAHNAIVYTEGANTVNGLVKQRLRWKGGRFQTFFDHRHLFFSTNPRHNRLLTWLILPLAIFGDTQLFFEVLFLLFLYVYSFMTHDFSSFISGILIVSSMFAVQIFDDRRGVHKGLYILAPIGWLLFYFTTVVEYHALIKSIWGIVSKRKFVWQRWERNGCLPAGNQV
jgi:cellulose synthase/poly-beta-1,6-N-acetylglucosamine synthase-like glycosyltransferase